jgi:sulfate permease, SulP family
VLLQLQPRLLGWGLPDTPAVLLALMCVLSAISALIRAALFMLQADRFTRLIPAPVFAGYAISVSAIVLISQSERLWSFARAGHPLLALLLIGLASAGVALWVSWRKPSWPAAALGLLAGALTGLVCAFYMPGVLTVMSFAALGWQWPFQLADFSALVGANVAFAPLLQALLLHGALIGVSAFLNTSLANETVSQLDDRYAKPWQHGALSLVGLGAGLLGSVPMSASNQSSAAALRSGALGGRKVMLAALICGLLALTGLFNHIALAAVATVMLVDAFFMADRPALKQAWQWLRGKALNQAQKEDTWLVMIVTFSAVALNAIVGVFVGLMFGLLLFAKRNARHPVRFEWTGLQLSANANRDAVENQVLAQHGQRICILELESELFFGSVRSLDETLLRATQGASVLVLDWSRVRHVDSSVALSLSRWRRHEQSQQISTIHAGAGLRPGNASDFLDQHAISSEQRFKDLDHALEQAETLVIEQFLELASDAEDADDSVLPLFIGLSDPQLRLLDMSLPQQLIRAGELLIHVGQPSESIYVVVQGSLAVVASDSHGREVRLAKVSRGGVLGEIGFFDRIPATANVRALKDTLVLQITRPVLIELQRDYPDILTQLLINLTRILSTKLRNTNKLALSRS